MLYVTETLAENRKQAYKCVASPEINADLCGHLLAMSRLITLLMEVSGSNIMFSQRVLLICCGCVSD